MKNTDINVLKGKVVIAYSLLCIDVIPEQFHSHSVDTAIITHIKDCLMYQWVHLLNLFGRLFDLSDDF